MTLKAFPVKFEILDTELGDMIGKVEAFDDCSASVIADTVFGVESWREFSAVVEQCLIAMVLK